MPKITSNKAFIEGIIIRSVDYSDSSKILTVYTSEGNISVMAKGVRKIKSDYRNLAQILTKIRFLRTDKPLTILNDATLISSYKSIKDDLIKYAYASAWTELYLQLIDEHSPHDKTYRLLNEYLSHLANHQADYVSLVFELKLLHYIGFAPHFSSCIHCASEKNISGFNLESGGVVCHKCKSQPTLDLRQTLTLMTCFFFNSQEQHFTDLPMEDLLTLRRFVDRFYMHHVGFTPTSFKSLKLLKKE